MDIRKEERTDGTPQKEDATRRLEAKECLKRTNDCSEEPNLSSSGRHRAHHLSTALLAKVRPT